MRHETPLKVLLVDDEEIVHRTLGQHLSRLGLEVHSARDGRAGVEELARGDYDLALVDVRMPELGGLGVLAEIARGDLATEVVMITGEGTMEQVIEALRLGAVDFLTKPVRLLDLEAVVEKVRRLRELRRGQRRLRRTIDALREPSGTGLADRLIGSSAATERLRREIRQAVDRGCDTVLLLGETGTGKEVAARELHRLAAGDEGPFVAVSCPAIPDTLVEAELFGHTKGAFTGATVDRPGCFELADGGTLFLDEVGDLTAAAQAKLLRALETRTVQRVGGVRTIRVDVRVVAATHRDLHAEVVAGRFRQDLYYRLALFPIHISPLRERREDILPLAEHFAVRFATARRLPVPAFTPAARAQLQAYSYPGNVRELKNEVDRAVVLCESGAIGPEHLDLRGPTPAGAAAEAPASESGEADEAARLRRALEEARWNRRGAARALGITYSALRHRMQRHGIR